LKQFKTLVALVLVAMMTFSMCAALADAPTPGTGKITVKNAAKGETYKLFKIFDATVAENGGITYTGTIPADLTDYFTTNAAGNITKAAGKTDDEIAEAVADYVETLTESSTGYITKATGDGTPVVFDNLAFGYYGVTTSQGAAVTVDSTNPEVEIFDKNKVTITPQKKVNGKDVDDVYVGETVTFTAKFGPLPNYIGEYQVQSYTIDDTLPAYLENVTITSIIIYNGDPDATENAGTQVGTNSATAFTNKKVVIPWVNDATPAANIYPNKSYIKVTYTAKIGDMAVIDGDGNRNDVTITPNKDKTGENPFDEHYSDHAEVKTYGAALIKVDGTDTTKTLKGAKFTIDGFEVVADPNGEPGVYRITGSKSGASTEMSTNDDGVLYILGVDGTVSVTETVAPAGYNRITTPFDLPKQILSDTIWTKTEDKYFDSHGNLVASSSSETTTTQVQKNYTDLKPEALKVKNNAGAELPSTGGIGTTIFYVAGIVLVLGAAAVIIARRKAEQ